MLRKGKEYKSSNFEKNQFNLLKYTFDDLELGV